MYKESPLVGQLPDWVNSHKAGLFHGLTHPTKIFEKSLQFVSIDVIFNLVENNIGTRIHSGHGNVARDYSLGK